MRLIAIREVKPGDAARVAGLPKLTRAQFRKILASGPTRVVTDASLEKSRKNSQAVRAAVAREFATLTTGKPEVAVRFQGDLIPRGYRAKVPGGEEYHLLAPVALQRDLVLLKRLHDDPKSAGERYGALHAATRTIIAGLPAGAARSAKRTLRLVPNPDQMRLHSRQEIMAGVDRLTKMSLGLAFPLGVAPPVTPAPACSAEIGTGYGGDMDDGGPAAPNPLGLLTTAQWPLKEFNTCVRNQGRRGSCPAFGIIAAVESAIAVKDRKWVNLSEQDLYKQQKLDWSLSEDYYDDGYYPPLSLLYQMAGSYVFPYERDWHYNPSFARQADAAARTYTHSCDGYNGQFCSDTNHQAEQVCYRVDTKVIEEVVDTVCYWAEQVPLIGALLGEWVCEPVTRAVETVSSYTVCIYQADPPASSGYRVTSIWPVWDPLFDTDIALAKVMLAARVPLVFSFNVPLSFGAGHPVNGKGYVAYDANEGAPPNMGGHCSLLTGAIDNANLPAGVAPGSGGGYFILKNSWGRGSGDCGYHYLPYDWVTKWGVFIVALAVG